jgi:hypothetical protein
LNSVVLGSVVATPDGCVELMFGTRLVLNGRTLPPARAIWALAYGSKPGAKKVAVVAVCGNEHCVRLDHLRPGRFGPRPLPRCGRGHFADKRNVWISPNSGRRGCRPCAALRARGRRARERARAA